MGDSYESFYNGGISSFDKGYGTTENWGSYSGARMFSSNLGFPGSVQSANQLNEAVSAIRQGVKAFEVTMGDANVAESIPKQNFQEMQALMRLTGVTPSVHAPFGLDPSGFTQQGYSKEMRAENERRFFNVLERAGELKKDKNVAVVFHSSAGVPGTEYRPGDEKKGEARFQPTKIALIEQETGQLASQIDEDRKIYFEHPEQLGNIKKPMEAGLVHKPLEDIHIANASMWRQKMFELANLKKMGDEIVQYSPTQLEKLGLTKITDEADIRKKLAEMNDAQKDAFARLQDAQPFLQQAHLKFNSIFELAYKYGTDGQREKLKELAENYKREMQKEEYSGTFLGVAKDKEMMDDAIRKVEFITTHETMIDPYTGKKVSAVPTLLVPSEEFAKKKSAETFGNLAWRSFNEIGKGDADKAPVIAIENMFMGFAFPRAEDMKNLVEASQKKFVENAVAKGMDEDRAKDVAKKLIGVTWDVGHLNVMKKAGFTDEDVVKETEKIAKMVKHVHLTDNFGYSDSHLAPGMGNVPIKKILEKLEKEGRLNEMSKIVEAPSFVQHFKKSPHGWTMAALGSPIYGAMMGPYWNQVSALAGGGGYFGGPMAYFPEKHFSMYGSGFSSLPTELGGQIPGTASRFSGTPTG